MVAPTSVARNWVAECRKFTPGLNAVVVTATDARAAMGLAEQVAEADIVVTSYTLLRMDVAAYSQITWAGMVLDEAQFVKNHHSKTHQAARLLDVPFKLAITGTPMENNLMELWSLLSITVPGLFPSPKVFETYFRKADRVGSRPATCSRYCAGGSSRCCCVAPKARWCASLPSEERTGVSPSA